MPLIKRDYTDEETVITAQNLNDIQDAIQALEDGLFTVDDDKNGAVIAITDAAKRGFRSFNIYGRTEQNGTPTPEAPVELVSAGSAGSINVYVTGKNLLKCSATGIASNGVTFAVLPDGSVSASGTATANAYLQVGKVYLAPGKYYLNGDLSGSSSTHRTFITNGVNEYNNYTADKEFTVRERGSWTVSILIQKGTSVSGVLFYPMIRSADIKDSTFEPYKENKLEIATPSGLPGIPVNSGGSYTDANGQQWICDEIDLTNGVYIKRVGVVVLDGSSDELWAFSTSYGMYQHYIAIQNVKLNSGVLNSAFQSENRTIEDGYSFVGSTGRLSCFSSTINTAASWREYLSTTPITVYYMLDEPITEALSDESISAYAALHTYKENATVTNDAGAFMDLEYVMDTKKYIDGILKVEEAPRYADVILPASKWTGTGSLYSQVVSLPGINANSQVNLTPTVQQMTVFYEKDISFITENDGGVVTIYVIGQKPENDYTIPAKIVEVRA